MLNYIDELLKTKDRAMLLHPDLITCGSTGNRVYGSFNKNPGLCGVFHFVHKSDIEDLIELKFQDIVNPLKLKTEYEWRPSYLYMRHFYPCFVIEEKKYITENDLIVSSIYIKSISGSIRFKLGLKSKVLDYNFEKKMELFNQLINIKAFCSDNELFGLKEFMLEQGQELCFTLACGFKVEEEQWTKSIPSLEQHRQQYGKFFEGIPKLTCSNKAMEKVYYYRWFLLRHHIANPRLGNIRYPIIYEGRYGYFAEQGIKKEDLIEWEFSRGILAPASHQILDMRWHSDSEIVKGEVLNFTENFGKMESFLGYDYDIPLLPGCIRIHDFIGHYFFHITPFAVWQAYECIKDKDWLAEVEPILWKDLSGWCIYDPDNSGLPEMKYEGDSAMEFGPASHYHGKHTVDKTVSSKKNSNLEIGLTCKLETDSANWGEPVSNRRTEVAAYYGLNYYAFYKIYEIMGNEVKAENCFSKYKEIKKAVIKHMWNTDENYFLELASDFKQIPNVKQIGGILCLLLVDPENPEKYLNNLLDKSKFNQKFGIASTSKDSFGYSPNNTVNGTRAHTCMWNGPTWPFSTSLALIALGSYIKRLKDEQLKKSYSQYFQEEFLKYTELHFLFGDKNNVKIVEHYDCETSMPLSYQDDYNHSSFIDIIVRMVCGLDIDSNGKVNFSPIGIGHDYIKLEKIKFNGLEYCIEIIYDNAFLYCNGKVIEKVISNKK